MHPLLKKILDPPLAILYVTVQIHETSSGENFHIVPDVFQHFTK